MNEFLEAYFLKDSKPVTFHVVIPTALITELNTHRNVYLDAASQKADHYIRQCAMCCAALSGKVAQFCIRLISSTTGWTSKVATHAAYLCAKCRVNHPAYINSCGKTSFALLKRIDCIIDLAADMEYDQQAKCPREMDIVDVIFQRCRDDQNEIMHMLGKTDNVCNFCKAPKTHSRCGGCNLYRYCCTMCQKKDWNQHRSVCKVLQQGDALLSKKLIIIKQVESN